MNIIKYILSVLVLYSCSAGTNYSTNSRQTGPTIAEPGACYAKSVMPASYRIQILQFPIYTGLDASQRGVESKTIVLKEGGTKWIKKRSTENCNSPDPNDCLVWCMVEYPAEKVTLQVADTSIVSEYHWQEIEKKTRLNDGGHIDWVQVLCNADIRLLEEIQTVLQKENIYQGFITGRFDSETKQALTTYQKQNDLPVGNLDFATLDAMHINY